MTAVFRAALGGRVAKVRVALLFALFLLVSGTVGIRSGRAIELDWVMYEDPLLPSPEIVRPFPAKLVEVWLQALESTDRDLRRRTATAIGQAHSLGLTGLGATIPPLTAILKETGQSRRVRLAVASALVTIDADEEAELLFAQLGQDVEMAELIEPALARWRYPPVRDLLVSRLENETAPRRQMILAIRGLVEFQEVAAVPRLTEIAASPLFPAPIRLEAALAVGELDDQNSLEAAANLAADRSPTGVLNRLIGVKLLKRHRGAAAERLLTQLAADQQPAVQSIALGHLYRVNPDLILPMVDDVVRSPDVKVRRWGAESLIARPSPENLVKLAPLIDDRDPDLRRGVCDALLEFTASAEWREIVIEQARAILSRDSWRGQEQATLLLVTLDDKSIAPRLIELLDADRAEAHATAAWGLCRLQIPETAEPILKVLDAKTKRYLAGDPVGDRMQLQLAHLATAVGRLKYSAADDVLREYIDKSTPLPDVPRSAAIWALGHLSENATDEELIGRLHARLVDVNSMVPESPEVRTMAAVSLGRLHAMDTLDSLRAMLRIEKIQTGAGYSCAWAIHELTGEPIPELGPAVFPYNGWFLMPTGE